MKDLQARPFTILSLAISLLVTAALPAAAQTKKLPSAEKIVEKYIKAVGGKKRVAAVQDTSLEYLIQLNGETVGVAKMQTKRPSAARSELTFGNGQIVSSANASSVWTRGLDGELRTLTGTEAGAAKLQAALDATQLLDYKKVNVAARVLSAGDLASEPAYIVEFSTRAGAKLLYYFSQKTGLITKIADDVRRTMTRFADYRAVDGLLLAHQIKLDLRSNGGELTLLLQKATFNVGVPVTSFDAPRAVTLDVPELLRTVSRNQEEVEKRFTEYSFLQKETDKTINSKGEVKKETVKVYEVFPIANREPVLKLISENGVPLTAERAAKEEKRVLEEFMKAERDREKDELKAQKRRTERLRRRARGDRSEDEDLDISEFLKACEFVSPRLERFRDREVVVFDFRPRPEFKPSSRQEELISKLVGVVWIDPADKQVIRLEARLAEGFKMAGGLLLSLKPGASVVMEQTRMNEGLWLPRLAQINLSVKVLLFGGGDINKTFEFSDYKRFSGDVKDYQIESVKQEQIPRLN